MSYADYAEHFADSPAFHALTDEMYRGDEYSAETCLAVMERHAASDDVTLTDKDAFDYEAFFWNAYSCAEKGLS